VLNIFSSCLLSLLLFLLSVLLNLPFISGISFQRSLSVVSSILWYVRDIVKVKRSLYQALEACRIVRRRGSPIDVISLQISCSRVVGV
jgi:ribosomal protein L36